MSKRISIIGPFPPPIGGIATVVKRVAHLLANHRYETTIIASTSLRAPRDIAGYRVWPAGGVKCINFRHNTLYLLAKSKPNIVHVHVSSLSGSIGLLALAALARAMNARIVLSIHGSSFKEIPGNVGRNDIAVMRQILKLVDRIVLVESELWLPLYALFGNTFQHKTCIIPAFLLPPNQGLPPLIERDGDGPVFLTTGTWSRIYNLDLVIQTVAQLRNEGLVCNARLILCTYVYGKIDEAYREQILALIHEHRDFVSLVEDYPEMERVYRSADILILATSRDTFCMAIPEALFFGLPFVASDVTTRPPGVVTFDLNNQADLKRKLHQVVSQLEDYRNSIIQNPPKDFAKPLLDLYDSLFDCH